ncbi:MAG: peptidase dimerization domain-containing protein [Planctomycetota bacterium]|jgi:di/tripeptidase
MSVDISPILAELPAYRKGTQALKDILVTNLVMAGEIPSPTFQEEGRATFLQDRFTECGLQNISADEAGNATGILYAGDDRPNILIVAHLDSLFTEQVDHTVTVQPDRVCGATLSDNALGVATLASLPTLMEKLDITYNANLILMGSAHSLGRGDLQGLKFFLENTDRKIAAAICVEGARLGRLSHTSIGIFRGEITCTVPEEYDWTRFGAVGAIATLNEVINRILEIPLPKRPQSSIVLGSIEGGQSYNEEPTEALLRFEIRSESAEQVAELHRRLEEIVTEVSLTTKAEVNLDVFAQRTPGGIPFTHPLTRAASAIIKALGLQPRVSPSTTDLAAFIEKEIPALTLGVTTGERLNTKREELLIEPMFTGLAQLLGMLKAIDEGVCNDG